MCLCVRACVCDWIPRYNVIVCVCAYMYIQYSHVHVCVWFVFGGTGCQGVCVHVNGGTCSLNTAIIRLSQLVQCHYILAHMQGGGEVGVIVVGLSVCVCVCVCVCVS